jgi:serine/threonine protein kinase, bacterial
VHDRSAFDGQLWIAMEYVAGTNAAELLSDRCPDGMPADDVIKIVAAVASALDYAHKEGLLHRDVKPANIMLTDLDEDGERRIVLSDFGVARNMGEISGLTATNMAVGTVAYAAPEHLMGEDLDGRADEYALAASTYHMLSGSQPFRHSNPAVVISHHLNSPPPALANTRPGQESSCHAKRPPPLTSRYSSWSSPYFCWAAPASAPPASSRCHLVTDHAWLRISSSRASAMRQVVG